MKQFLLALLISFISIKGFSATGSEEANPADSASISLPHLVDPVLPEALATFKEEKRREFEEKLGMSLPSSKMIRQFDNFDAPATEAYSSLLEFDELDPMVYEEPFLNDTTEAYRARAFELLEFVEAQQRFTDQLDETTILDLPIGIKKTIGNISYTILIDSMVILSTHSYLTAYMAFEVPSNGKKIAFRGTNIRFSKKGGLTGNARLELVGDHAMKMGEETLLILKGEGRTYVEWDCFGFKNMGIDAEIEFSKDLFLPDTENGKPGDGRVRARFTTSLGSWDDLVAEVNMDPFQVKGLEGVGFTVKKAVLDYSTIRQAPGVVYPSGYSNAAFDPAEPAFWQGFYLSELSVRLPKQFQKDGSSERISFGAYDVIIDDMGFSGTVEARNVLGDGKMDKWPFTVETLSITMVANQIQGAGFEGLVTVPVDKKNPFEYKAIINPGNEYIFAVSPSKSLEFEFLKAGEVELAENSYLEVKVKDQKFLPKAHLNGKLSIQTGEAKLASLTFERLEIQSVKPYIKLGGFSLGNGKDKHGLGKFPIGINNIGLAAMDDPNEVGVRFDVTVSLVGENDGAFGGTGGLIVVGKSDPDGKNLSYDRLEITKIGVAFNTGAVELAATLEWFKNDYTYGDGIRGTAKVTVIDKITVDAVALFGKKEDMRFWFFDALATLPGGGAGTGIVVKSFGGGAYFHMKQATSGGSALGESLSGVRYVPDESTYLGLKATVDLATAGSDKLFNGDATLEISFNRGGGIRMIDFKGNGYFMTPPSAADLTGLKERAGGLAAGAAGAAINFMNPKAQVAAHIHINYDVPNKTLHGNFEVFVNVAGGVVKGIGSNNRAGWVVLHVSPEEWYIHVGSPDDPVGLKMIGILKTQSYLMVGDNIPGSPPPPDKVSEILGGVDLDYMKDLNTLGSGRGFAFGTRVDFDTGDLTFLMFYARFQAGMGFDIMVKDYGNATCAGSSGPIGINGWYANGQAYAYFDGSIGIKVKLFGKRKKVEILSIGAAAILQAKLPNPFWMRGIVGGRFSVLGGLVKGECKFEVTLGEECQIQGGSVLEGIKVIAEVTPAENTKDVSVFNASQGIFNMEIGKRFEMVDLDEKKKVFRIKLDHFKLLDGSYEIPGSLEWNHHNDVVAFNPVEILPPQKTIKLKLQVSFEELEGGTWKPVKVDGNPYIEAKEISFSTGTAPDYIPHENVQYSYPVISQYNFHKDETRTGYIKLKVGQQYLFQPGSEWIQKGRFRAANGEIRYFDISYNQQQINFSIPANLTNERIYAFEMVNLPASGPEPVDINVTEQTAGVDLGEAGGDQTLEVETKQAEGQLDILQEKLIFESFIKTSKYSRFIDKVAAMQISDGWSWPVLTGIHELGVNVTGNELFDEFEVNRQENFGPLVQFEAVLSNNYWYENTVKSLIYPSYPAYGLTIDWRDPEIYGVPPVRAVYITQSNEPRKLSEDEIRANTFSATNGYGSFVYNLPYVSYWDYENLRQKAAERQVNGTANSWMQRLLTTHYPGIISGNYKMLLQYKLPGINRVTSSKMINIYVD